jgi:hypothetical protein
MTASVLSSMLAIIAADNKPALVSSTRGWMED